MTNVTKINGVFARSETCKGAAKVDKISDTPMTLGQIAAYIGGKVIGNPHISVKGLVSPEKSGEKTLSVVWEEKELGMLSAEAFLAAPEKFFTESRQGIVTEKPREAFARLLYLFKIPQSFPYGIHPSAVVSENARIADTAYVGPLCVIEENAVIHDEAILEAQVYVGARCSVGKGTHIEPMAVLYENVTIGERGLIHSGAIIGCDGFGIIPSSHPDERPQKVPQIGGVVIDDDVEIGACTTIDRGTLDDTYIGKGTKVDDHVHIAHNARIGDNCIVVAMTGIAGSAEIGEGVILAARSGVRDHVKIGNRAQVAANGGVIKDVPPGEIVSGFPARPHKEQFRAQALYLRLPELFSRIKALEKRLAESGEDSK